MKKFVVFFNANVIPPTKAFRKYCKSSDEAILTNEIQYAKDLIVETRAVTAF